MQLVTIQFLVSDHLLTIVASVNIYIYLINSQIILYPDKDGCTREAFYLTNSTVVSFCADALQCFVDERQIFEQIQKGLLFLFSADVLLTSPQLVFSY